MSVSRSARGRAARRAASPARWRRCSRRSPTTTAASRAGVRQRADQPRRAGGARRSARRRPVRARHRPGRPRRAGHARLPGVRDQLLRHHRPARDRGSAQPSLQGGGARLLPGRLRRPRRDRRRRQGRAVPGPRRGPGAGGRGHRRRRRGSRGDHAGVADRGARAGGAPAAQAPDEDAVFQYSAGCTGGPKRVPRTQGQLRFEADSLVATLGLDARRRRAQRDPAVPQLRHGHAACSPHCAAARRCGSSRTRTRSCSSATMRCEVLERERVTVFPAVPFILRLLAEAPGSGDLSALRLCLSAAAALPRPTFDAFDQRFGVAIRQLYGFTEGGAVRRTSTTIRRPRGARSGVRSRASRSPYWTLPVSRWTPGTSARSRCAARP